MLREFKRFLNGRVLLKGVIKQVYKVLRLLPKPLQLRILRTMTEVLGFLRKLHLLPFSEYRSLKRYKNIHKGERCFIVATGPSLTIEDVGKLKGEFAFSMNSMVLSYGDTAWRPTYYLVQDQTSYSKLCLEDCITLSDAKGVFLSPEIDGWLKHIKRECPYSYDVFPYNSYRDRCVEVIDSRKWIPSPHKPRFSADIAAAVYGHNATYSCLQITSYMGFSEIYLLGCDCTLGQNEKNNIVNYGSPITSKEESAKAAYNESVMLMFQSAKEYADKHGIKILNATRGGSLEVFERVDLDEVLKGKTI